MFLLLGFAAIAAAVWIVRWLGMQRYFELQKDWYKQNAPRYADNDKSIWALVYARVGLGFGLGVVLVLAGVGFLTAYFWAAN